MNSERLMLVVRALRESPDPSKFAMHEVVNVCGSPACAIGHLFCRPDLQQRFHLTKASRMLSIYELVHDHETGRDISYDDDAVMDWLDLDESSFDELFAASGCDNAQTTEEAADFIESWVSANG